MSFNKYKIIFVPIAILLLWLMLYQIIVLDTAPGQAISSLVNSLELLVTDAGIFLMGTILLLFLFIISLVPGTLLLDIHCYAKLEYLLDDFLMKGKVGKFLYSLLYFEKLPKPKSIVPKTIKGAVFAMSIIYLLSLIFNIYYGEVLFWIISSAGFAKQVNLAQDAALITPLLAMLVVYVTRILVFFEYPQSSELALFLPLTSFFLLIFGVYLFFYRFTSYVSYWGTLAQNGDLPYVLRNVLYFAILPILIEMILWGLHLKRKR